jgi:hypothetical protein
VGLSLFEKQAKRLKKKKFEKKTHGLLKIKTIDCPSHQKGQGRPSPYLPEKKH